MPPLWANSLRASIIPPICAFLAKVQMQLFHAAPLSQNGQSINGMAAECIAIVYRRHAGSR